MDVRIERSRVRLYGALEICFRALEQLPVVSFRELLQVDHSEIVEKQRMVRHNCDGCEMVSLGCREIIAVVCLVAAIVIVETNSRNGRREDIHDGNACRDECELRL